MTKFVLDSYAWIEYFIGSQRGSKVKEYIESPDNEIFTSIITIAEISSITKRENRDVEDVFVNINNLSEIYNINSEFAKEAGILHAEIRKKIKDFGMADTVILLTARKLNAKVITGDPHFKDFKEAVLI